MPATDHQPHTSTPAINSRRTYGPDHLVRKFGPCGLRTRRSARRAQLPRARPPCTCAPAAAGPATPPKGASPGPRWFLNKPEGVPSPWTPTPPPTAYCMSRRPATPLQLRPAAYAATGQTTSTGTSCRSLPRTPRPPSTAPGTCPALAPLPRMPYRVGGSVAGESWLVSVRSGWLVWVVLLVGGLPGAFAPVITDDATPLSSRPR
jgi:hypothetical protein